MRDQLLHVVEDTLSQLSRRFRLIEPNVVGNGLQIVQGRLCPNQLSHRAIRFFASA